MAERVGFEPTNKGYLVTRFPVVLLRPTRTPFHAACRLYLRRPGSVKPRMWTRLLLSTVRLVAARLRRSPHRPNLIGNILFWYGRSERPYRSVHGSNNSLPRCSVQAVVTGNQPTGQSRLWLRCLQTSGMVAQGCNHGTQAGRGLFRADGGFQDGLGHVDRGS